MLDVIPPIVPQDVFDRVQERLAKNKSAPAHFKAEEEYLLTTKLFCGYCGVYLCGESGTSRTGTIHHYYMCVSVKKRRTDCHKKPVRKQWIEDIVVRRTMEMLQDDDAIQAIVELLMEMQEQEGSELPLYERQLAETNTAINNVLNAIQQGILTRSTKERLEELEKARDELEAKIAQEKMDHPKISAEFMTFCLQRFRELDVTRQEHRRMLIDTFVNVIFLYDDKMVLTFNYKEGQKTIKFSELEEAQKGRESGSDMDCPGEPIQHDPNHVFRIGGEMIRIFFVTDDIGGIGRDCVNECLSRCHQVSTCAMLPSKKKNILWDCIWIYSVFHFTINPLSYLCKCEQRQRFRRRNYSFKNIHFTNSSQPDGCGILHCWKGGGNDGECFLIQQNTFRAVWPHVNDEASETVLFLSSMVTCLG